MATTTATEYKFTTFTTTSTIGAPVFHNCLPDNQVGVHAPMAEEIRVMKYGRSKLKTIARFSPGFTPYGVAWTGRSAYLVLGDQKISLSREEDGVISHKVFDLGSPYSHTLSSECNNHFVAVKKTGGFAILRIHSDSELAITHYDHECTHVTWDGTTAIIYGKERAVAIAEDNSETLFELPEPVTGEVTDFQSLPGKKFIYRRPTREIFHVQLGGAVKKLADNVNGLFQFPGDPKAAITLAGSLSEPKLARIEIDSGETMEYTLRDLSHGAGSLQIGHLIDRRQFVVLYGLNTAPHLDLFAIGRSEPLECFDVFKGPHRMHIPPGETHINFTPIGPVSHAHASRLVLPAVESKEDE
ncbi:MAG: hypothetical protein MRY21_04640 [Simkaniaceae bacterium]|nr:hypothetical protein [Simkaniaceae bacterium]